jgi:hypothetical protein
VLGRLILGTSALRSSKKFASGDGCVAYEYRPFGGCA